MKKILMLFLLMLAFMMPAFQVSAAELSTTDKYQAGLWMNNIRNLYKVGEYQTLRYYCEKVISFYPETDYATEAQEFLKKTEKPKKNKRREMIRNDPALTFGGW